MPKKDTFKDQPKLRHAEFINPPNILKKKVGSGGIDAAVLVKAQKVIDTNKTDFKPIAIELLEILDKGIEHAGSGSLKGEAAIEAMLYPAAQLKAQGAMFRFPLVSDVSDILVSFLETITVPPSPEVLEIVTAHKMAISVIISNDIASEMHPHGKELKTSLLDACARYYKAKA
jgi:hypothetical protein